MSLVSAKLTLQRENPVGSIKPKPSTKHWHSPKHEVSNGHFSLTLPRQLSISRDISRKVVNVVAWFHCWSCHRHGNLSYPFCIALSSTSFDCCCSEVQRLYLVLKTSLSFVHICSVCCLFMYSYHFIIFWINACLWSATFFSRVG